MTHKMIAVLFALTMAAVPAFAEDAVILLKNGTKVKPANNVMNAGKDGSIAFTDIYGKRHSYSRGQIRYISNDCPKSVQFLEKLFRYQKYDELVKTYDKLGPNDLFLGWGGVAVYLKAMSLVQLNKFDDAEETLKKGMFIAVAENRDDVLKGGMKIIEMIKRPSRAPSSVSPLNLVLGAIVYEKQNKYRESALEYMKVVMLYPPQDKQGVNLERLVAMARLIDVLKADKDMGTANTIVATMQSGN